MKLFETFDFFNGAVVYTDENGNIIRKKYLDDNGKVYRTVYEDGTEILHNTKFNEETENNKIVVVQKKSVFQSILCIVVASAVILTAVAYLISIPIVQVFTHPEKYIDGMAEEILYGVDHDEPEYYITYWVEHDQYILDTIGGPKYAYIDIQYMCDFHELDYNYIVELYDNLDYETVQEFFDEVVSRML